MPKRFLLLLLQLLTAFVYAQSDSTDKRTEPGNPYKGYWINSSGSSVKYKRHLFGKEMKPRPKINYSIMKYSGPVITAGGGILLYTVIQSSKRYKERQNKSDYYEDPHAGNGSLVRTIGGIVGVNAIGGGVAMFIIGSKRLKILRKEVAFTLAPSAAGVAYRF